MAPDPLLELTKQVWISVTRRERHGLRAVMHSTPDPVDCAFLSLQRRDPDAGTYAIAEAFLMD